MCSISAQILDIHAEYVGPPSLFFTYQAKLVLKGISHTMPKSEGGCFCFVFLTACQIIG